MLTIYVLTVVTLTSTGATITPPPKVFSSAGLCEYEGKRIVSEDTKNFVSLFVCRQYDTETEQVEMPSGLPPYNDDGTKRR